MMQVTNRSAFGGELEDNRSPGCAGSAGVRLAERQDRGNRGMGTGAWVVLDAATGDNIWDHELARIEAGDLVIEMEPGNFL